MFARKTMFSSIGRAAVMATVAALALTVVEPTMARAGSSPAGPGLSAGTSGATDFSSARRHYYRGGGGAAAIGAFAAIVGTGLAIAAARDDYYYDGYDGGAPAYYGGGPVYYGGGPVYYGGSPAYYGGWGYGYGGASRPYFRGHPIPDGG
jgi:hypothetical protein